MSTKYPGGIISKTAPTPSGPYADSTAPGVWTLEQQAYWQKLGQWPTAGNVNPNAFIENLFSTYLYTGNGSTQTITNGIDLSTNGGLVWSKARSSALSNFLCDTVRGRAYYLYSNATVAQQGPSASGNDITSFNSNGYSLGPNANADINTNAVTFASWTFRKQAKFFDMVTYTGDGTTSRSINHNLTSTPGCIIVKRTDSTGSWYVYHRGVDPTSAYAWYLLLNSTAARAGAPAVWDVPPTSTAFTVQNGTTNDSGATYVAYLFAHDAGGFGLSGTENVISCGSFVPSGDTTVTLGYEPQWILIKRTDASDSWKIWDNMRGWAHTTYAELYPNTSATEAAGNGNYTFPTATGFVSKAGWLTNGATYVYVAIRRGPMAAPTVGTSVYAPVAQIATGSYPRPVVTNFPVDFVIMGDRGSTWGYNWSVQDRLRGNPNVLFTSDTVAENTGALSSFASNTQFGDGWISGSASAIFECMRRAPSFLDVVCYTGTGTGGTTFSHNLGVTPELMIIKSRSASGNWPVYSAATGNTKVIYLNYDTYASASNEWNNTTPTASVFTLGTNSSVNNPGTTYVAYLFATCAGVSKVGSYTGTGTTLQINCGFTGGARFVMIKRYDSGSTGDWYVWDSARGIVAGNDPYLLINSTAAEVTGTDYVDTYSAGFEISSTAPSAINASGGTFIFLAIA